MWLALALLGALVTFAWPIVGYRRQWWNERDGANRPKPRSHWLVQLSTLLALGGFTAIAISQASIPVALAWILAAWGFFPIFAWLIVLNMAPRSPHPAPVIGAFIALSLIWGSAVGQALAIIS
jgi:hypothetical protein